MNNCVPEKAIQRVEENLGIAMMIPSSPFAKFRSTVDRDSKL